MRDSCPECRNCARHCQVPVDTINEVSSRCSQVPVPGNVPDAV